MRTLDLFLYLPLQLLKEQKDIVFLSALCAPSSYQMKEKTSVWHVQTCTKKTWQVYSPLETQGTLLTIKQNTLIGALQFVVVIIFFFLLLLCLTFKVTTQRFNTFLFDAANVATSIQKDWGSNQRTVQTKLESKTLKLHIHNNSLALNNVCE